MVINLDVGFHAQIWFLPRIILLVGSPVFFCGLRSVLSVATDFKAQLISMLLSKALTHLSII